MNFLKGAGRFSEEILIFLTSGKHYKGISGSVRTVADSRRKRAYHDPDNEEFKSERQRLYRLIQMLKHDGLIAAQKKQGRSVQYGITNEGRDWLEKHAEGRYDDLPRGAYPKKQSEYMTIVTYDIPHTQRRFRDWLRGELIGIGLTMLQRSVFIGKVKIPEELLSDLVRLHLIDYVEIFEITKRGTLYSRK